MPKHATFRKCSFGRSSMLPFRYLMLDPSDASFSLDVAKPRGLMVYIKHSQSAVGTV